MLYKRRPPLLEHQNQSPELLLLGTYSGESISGSHRHRGFQINAKELAGFTQFAANVTSKPLQGK